MSGGAGGVLDYPGDFSRLLREIERRSGLHLEGYRTSYLKRRIGVRIRANGLGSYDEYLEFLRRNPEEYRRLLDRLTVNVTEFFRNPSTFRAFERKVLPELASRRDIRIWSAGCASGEEPYSIAILVSEFFGERGRRRVRIYATDIDSASLARGIKGEYDLKALGNVEPRLLEKYFVRRGRRFAVVPEIREMVLFERQDILRRRWVRFFDVVFCRNVAIYFSRDSLEVLYRNLHTSLRRGGFLVTGRVESLTGEVKQLFEVVDSREHIYRAAG
ncbi:MAG: protein-glutamate O-methyltransferase CheR [Euryarchaeota archaeon]|nr:protein-glutamate O-methyltransferase CheR [Euryarchaeota archaeon]